MAIVPPGGFAGYSQMTPASRAAWRTGPTRSGVRRKRKSRRAAKGARRAKRTTRGRKMKFGSPAWRKKYKLGKKKR